MEHLLAVTMKNDNLDRFVNDWDTVLAGMMRRPEDMVLEAILIRQLKVCSQMKDDIHDFERLTIDDPRRCYSELYRAAKRQIERKRLQTHRDEMTRFIAGGNAATVSSKSKGKGGSRPSWKGKGNNRSSSKAPDLDTKPENPLKGVCRFHLRGKCRAGESCSMKHNPPCIFHNKKGGRRLGDKRRQSRARRQRLAPPQQTLGSRRVSRHHREPPIRRERNGAAPQAESAAKAAAGRKPPRLWPL